MKVVASNGSPRKDENTTPARVLIGTKLIKLITTSYEKRKLTIGKKCSIFNNLRGLATGEIPFNFSPLSFLTS